jgi:hypothetical protein
MHASPAPSALPGSLFGPAQALFRLAWLSSQLENSSATLPRLLQAMFRLVQLWFQLGSDSVVVSDLEAGFRQVPSYKFIPLAYQIASRMSAGGPCLPPFLFPWVAFLAEQAPLAVCRQAGPSLLLLMPFPALLPLPTRTLLPAAWVGSRLEGLQLCWEVASK